MKKRTTDVEDDESSSVVDIHEDYTYNPERALMKKIRDTAAEDFRATMYYNEAI